MSFGIFCYATMIIRTKSFKKITSRIYETIKFEMEKVFSKQTKNII